MFPSDGSRRAPPRPPHPPPPPQPEHKIQSRATGRWDVSLAPVPKCLGLVSRGWCAGCFVVGFKVDALLPPPLPQTLPYFPLAFFRIKIPIIMQFIYAFSIFFLATIILLRYNNITTDGHKAWESRVESNFSL